MHMAVAELTPADRRIIRSADVLAAALVSKAEPGLLDLLRESFVANQAGRDAPEELQRILDDAALVPLLDDGRTPEAQVLELIGQALSILAAKAPHLVDPFRRMVSANCRNVAEAAGGTSAAEGTTMAAIEQALNRGPR
jgi:hypothetical protein